MRVIELSFPAENPEAELASTLRELGLALSPAIELKSYPGSQHWHVNYVNQPGTLELTWWPRKERFWIKVARNREAEWINEAMEAATRHFGTGRQPVP
jgi:hypothetical protein